MITVGITGGIGSGKTWVCRVFSEMGVPVYHADRRASEIMESDKDVRKSLIRLLGPEVYNGQVLDRKKMAGIIFHDPTKLKEVNRIVHPAVFCDFQRWKEQHDDFPYVLHEAAILFESGADKLMDYVISVYAPVKMRIKRIMERDGLKEDEVKARMKNQWSEKKRKQHADIVIYNDEKHLIVPKILSIHHELLARAGKQSLK